MVVKDPSRCMWCGTDPLYVSYHDEEWGVPSHDDRHLFEHLILEGAQAGLSWITILRKRKAYRKAFGQFNPKKIAAFTARDVARLMKDAGIVRNRLKIQSAIKNAKAFLAVQKEHGSFAKYLWDFVGGKTIVNEPKTLKDLVPQTDLSKRLSKDLKKRGFAFVGPVGVYAFLQAVGCVDDHMVSCFRKQKTA